MVAELVLPMLLTMLPTEDDIQIECLREAIYFEARGESIRGMALVGDVVANRVEDNSGYWEDTYCEVINSSKQFSYVEEVIDKTQYDEELSIQARAIAEAIFYEHEDFRGISNGALMYHANYVNPDWDYTKLEKLFQYKNHVFYDYAYNGRIK